MPGIDDMRRIVDAYDRLAVSIEEGRWDEEHFRPETTAAREALKAEAGGSDDPMAAKAVLNEMRAAVAAWDEEELLDALIERRGGSQARRRI